MRLFFTVLVALILSADYSFAKPNLDVNDSNVELSYDKDDLEDAIESALSYIKKGIYADSLDELKYYARKAKNYASEAEDIADDLGLDDVEDYSYDGYRYARAAEGASSMDDAVISLAKARRAMQNAYDEL